MSVLIVVGMIVLFVWNIILTFIKVSDIDIITMKHQQIKEITDKVLDDVKHLVGKEFAEKAVDEYLGEKWFGYSAHHRGEGSRLTKQIADYVTQDVEKYTKEYLSKEDTIDTIVNKLNKKQLKG